MEQLAPEILSSIALCLWEDSEESLAPFATLSRQWQPYIEAQTFRRLFLNPARLSEAISQNLLTPTRLSYLRYLRCEFIFPAHETDSTYPGDPDDEAVFIKTVNQLFNILSKTPPCKDPLVHLCLEIPVPGVFGSSEQYASDYGEPVDYPFVAQGQVQTSYLDFPPGYDVELPELPMVYKMSTSLISRSVVFSPQSICLMASKMPKLRRVTWELSDAEKLETAVRIQQRNGKSKTSPSTFAHANCDFHRSCQHAQKTTNVPRNVSSHLCSRTTKQPLFSTSQYYPARLSTRPFKRSSLQIYAKDRAQRLYLFR